MSTSNHSRILWTVLLLISLWLLSNPVQAKYSGGAGTADNPYQIATARDLMLLGESPEDYDKHFILTANIDLDPNVPGCKVFHRAVIAPDINDVNDNFQGTPFSGVFDGDGYTIKNISIDSDEAGNDYLGLFGSLSGDEAEIINLGLDNISIKGGDDSDFLGGLCGDNTYGRISNCHSTGSITGGSEADYLGGLCGFNGYDSSIENCSSTGTVTGDDCLGGLCGHNGYKSSITNCYSRGTVNGDDYLGGLCGQNVDHLCHISNCYSTCKVIGDHFLGGLCGYHFNHDCTGRISYCYSTGEVTGNRYVGGLCGYGPYREIVNCFWDIETSGQGDSAGGIGLTTGEMMNPYWYGLNGWASNPNWVLDEGKDYPRLAWELTAGQTIPETPIDWMEGSGTAVDPYQITKSDQMIMISQASALLDKHFSLLSDIDLTGLEIKPVDYYGDSFTGVFDGRGHTIRNLTIDLPDERFTGLFSCLDEGGMIKNLSVENITIEGWTYVGGLCGKNEEGCISNCYSTGRVSGGGKLGGLCGGNHSTIINCYSNANVLDRGVHVYDEYIGGLCGYNTGSITHCYSTGRVTCEKVCRRLGGLCGDNGGDMIGCFWDMESSGQLESNGGTGKTTDAMQTESTFTETHWDFVGEIENGLHEIWQMPQNGGYPALSFFNGYLPPVLSGEGTNESPYLISTAAELGSIIYQKQGVCYQLIQDLDLSGITWSMSVIPEFSGVFEGHDCTISNLVIKGHNQLALFGTVNGRSRIRNLDVVDANVVGIWSNWGIGNTIGILVGENKGVVSNCHITGSASGNEDIGGLCGYNNEGTIDKCNFDGVVSGTNYVGGIAGSSDNLATFSNCQSTGLIAGGSSAGGIVGFKGGGILTQCSFEGRVAGDWCVGGIVGCNNRNDWGAGVTADCFAAGNVTGDYCVGGIAGENWFSPIGSCGARVEIAGYEEVGGLVGLNCGEIGNCYATGSVTGTHAIGGLVGSNLYQWEDEAFRGEIVHCYSAGLVAGVSSVGGLVGVGSPHTVQSSFWDIETSGQINSEGGEGRTTAEMQNAHTFIDARWDFDRPIWTIEGQDYPQLVWDRPTHVFRIEIASGYDYEDPEDPDDTEYEFWLNVLTDETVEKIEFVTPARELFEISEIPEEQEIIEEGWIEKGREYGVERCAYEWYYGTEFDDPGSLHPYGDGDYTIIVYYGDGRQEQTTARFGIPGTGDAITQVVQKPTFTSFAHQNRLASPVTITWEPPIDPDVNLIRFDLENQDTDEEWVYELGASASGLDDPLVLSEGLWEANLAFGIMYETDNIDGINVWCVKYSASDYIFTIKNP
ncbi:MAG: hypothetical protein JXM79_20050 [Sedimentisphaerales bacterium]|nr:hypothetical protein [Sedimentisphaerales bacterium]